MLKVLRRRGIGGADRPPGGDLDTFIRAKTEEESALGEEMGDVFDMDIGGIG